LYCRHGKKEKEIDLTLASAVAALHNPLAWKLVMRGDDGR
jgi:hypothetical protein